MQNIDKRIIYGLVGVLVVILAIYLAMNKNESIAPTLDELNEIATTTNEPVAPTNTSQNTTTKPPTKAPVPVAAATVTYTDEGYVIGFSPSIVTIKKGESVLFVNESKASMWVASDPYPQSDIYPAFNQRGAGGSYTFTFTKSGKWTYHNHLDPQRKGTVIVKVE